MSDSYTFGHMLKDIFFNGNKISGNGSADREEESDHSYGGFSSSSSSSSRSGEFNPSEAAGEAFRSVFGDDNG